MAQLSVRPYAPGDRARVRAISYETGYLGSPPDWYWRDRKSFERIWTTWYTEEEPQSTFVAEMDGDVVGYLTGCVDSQRCPSPAEATTGQLLRRMLFLRPGTAGFFWRALYDVVRETGVPSGEIDDPRWPAHLHINLLPAARGQGGGPALMKAWLARLRELGVPGCHLGTIAENHRAIAFFERMGFRCHGAPTLLPGMRTPEGARHHLQLMVIDLHRG